MYNAASNEQGFKPAESRSETKAARTNHVARSILAAEVAKRDEKTKKLRKLRLANEKRQVKRDMMKAASKK